MARKRRRGAPDSPVFDVDSDGTVDSFDDFEVGDEHADEDNSDNAFLESDDTSSSDNEVINKQLYKKVVSKYTKLLKLKRDLKRKLSHQVLQDRKTVKKPKETFSRFSVTTFSKVVSALSGSKRELIESYGFGSLLDFDKCFVPVKFAKWIAQQVDYKSGDIIIGGKVISLTPESVHQVLGLPLGGHSFPTDISDGKAHILEKFNKQTVPSVMFFVEKLTLELDSMSDEDIFISFLLVALNTFLCPNASQTPCQKHLGIFADINHAKDFDWSGYVLSWLFQHIKSYNRGKSSKIKDEGTLGGCLFYLAVIYLDFVDFGNRMVSHDIPRISVWKGNMIQTYAQLDCKSNGSYGLRPKLDFSETCYANNLHLLDSRKPLFSPDDQFLEKLDLVSRCKLPSDLKNSICKIIQQHSLNCGLSLNLDLTAISTLPYSVHRSVTKLLHHASSIDLRSKNLVLEIMKVITEYPHDDVHPAPSVAPSEHTNDLHNADNSHSHEVEDASDSEPNLSAHGGFPTGSSPVLMSSLKVKRKTYEDMSPYELVLSQSKLKSYKVDLSPGKKIIHNVSNNNVSPATPSEASKRFENLPGCSALPPPVNRKCKPRLDPTETLLSKSSIANLRNPLCDLSNLDIDTPLKPGSDDGRSRDVILLGDDDDFVPDSLSPVPRPRCTGIPSVKVREA
ncbi:unnamed protein product [Urochloa humidicola]